MALYFDATQSVGYVFLMNSGEVQNTYSTNNTIACKASKERGAYFSITTPENVELDWFNWTAIDWANCVPPPSAYSTRTEQAAYLGLIIPNIAGTSFVATANSSYQTQQIGQLAAANRNYFASLNGTMVVNGNADANCVLPACTIKEVFFDVYSSNISTIATVSLLLNNSPVAHVDVPAGTTGLFSLGSLSVSADTTDRVALEISLLSGSGHIHFSPITTLLIIT